VGALELSFFGEYSSLTMHDIKHSHAALSESLVPACVAQACTNLNRSTLISLFHLLYIYIGLNNIHT